MKTVYGTMVEHGRQAEQVGCHPGETVTLHGNVYKIRKMSGFAFLILRTRRRLVQCVLEEGAGVSLSGLREEACVEVTGTTAAHPRSRLGWELQVTSLRVLSVPLETSPVVINQPSVPAALDALLEYRPVTLRNERERAVFRIQEGLVNGIRRYLSARDFTEIHTPKLVSAGAEGGAEIFHLDYFGKEACLAQSPQFYKQMMVGVYERVFEVGPVFRAEKHSTSRHLNEYTGIDLEMGYIECYEELMQLETELLRETFASLARSCAYELELLNVPMPEFSEIPTLTFAEAKDMAKEAGYPGNPASRDLEPGEEKLVCAEIARQTGSELVFITGYPTEKRPFYTMEKPGNPQITESFDLLFRGVEITTGGQRIHTYPEQVAKLNARGIPLEPFESYLIMHRFGMPPHGGLGIGLERLTAQLTGLDNVRRASLFPRDSHRITP